MSVQIGLYGTGIMALTGIIWWAFSSARAVAASEEDIVIETETPQVMSPDELVDLGTGNNAELILGARIASARNRVFIAGGISKALYTMLRDYLPYQSSLEMLINPSFPGKILLYEIQNRFATNIRQTDKILKDTVTFINIDGEYVFLLINATHQVLAARDREAATKLSVTNNNLWRGARPYTI